MRGIHETVERLAKGSLGRTEADIQSDVRKFLLDAPFELGADDVVDVALEAPVHGGGRIDIEVGFAAIEVKKSLSSPRTLADAKVQLRRYVRRRTEERGQRYVGLLTDGRVWILFHLGDDDDLAEVARLTVTGGQDARALAAWLEPVLATTGQIAPTPGEIKRRLGAESAAVQKARRVTRDALNEDGVISELDRVVEQMIAEPLESLGGEVVEGPDLLGALDAVRGRLPASKRRTRRKSASASGTVEDGVPDQVSSRRRPSS